MKGKSGTDLEYRLNDEISGSYYGRSPDGHPVLLVPTSDGASPSGRNTGGIAFQHRSNVRFRMKRRSFETPAVILTCTHDSLEATFRALATDVASRANAALRPPAPKAVSRLLALWEELLRFRRALSPEEEVGLWGELWLITQAPDTDRAVAAWKGPSAALTDFFGGGVGIECKTTMRRLEHHFSLAQLNRPLGDTPVFVQSLWVGQDENRGRTINDLVNVLAHGVSNPAVFEQALLGTGYSRKDIAQYTIRLDVLEPPAMFPLSAVPRVRDVDPGVSGVRFVSTLDPAAAVPSETSIALLAALCSAP